MENKNHFPWLFQTAGTLYFPTIAFNFSDILFSEWILTTILSNLFLPLINQNVISEILYALLLACEFLRQVFHEIFNEIKTEKSSPKLYLSVLKIIA